MKKHLALAVGILALFLAVLVADRALRPPTPHTSDTANAVTKHPRAARKAQQRRAMLAASASTAFLNATSATPLIARQQR